VALAASVAGAADGGACTSESTTIVILRLELDSVKKMSACVASRVIFWAEHDQVSCSMVNVHCPCLFDGLHAGARPPRKGDKNQQKKLDALSVV
jgi:hypothetical protein